METINFNINNLVSIKLTQDGVDVLNEKFSYRKNHKKFHRETWYEFQMWQLMMLLGGDLISFSTPDLFETDIKIHTN